MKVWPWSFYVVLSNKKLVTIFLNQQTRGCVCALRPRTHSNWIARMVTVCMYSVYAYHALCVQWPQRGISGTDTNVTKPFRCALIIVRQLRTKFEKDADIPDKSTNFFPRATHYLRFHFLIGATSSRYRMAAILDFQDDRQYLCDKWPQLHLYGKKLYHSEYHQM